MKANRETAGLTIQMQKMAVSKSSDEIAAGTKVMRQHIIHEKPSKKIVKEHIEAIIAQECESSSDEE